MKKKVLLIISLATAITLFFTGCEQLDGPGLKEASILPEKFSIEIPDAISFDVQDPGTKSVEPINGNLIYRHLAHFIHIGEGGGNIVEKIIKGIVRYEINKPMSLSYTGDDDGRIKNLEVTENPYFEGQTWEFRLDITDAESLGNEDGGFALQIFWNRNPIKGVAILKPYNIDRSKEENSPDAVFRIDYSEAGERAYDAYMLVAVSGLPLDDPLDNPYSTDALKMFVGKEGDKVDVYGNSNHPNAVFFNGDSGFNWAFVASGDATLDIGVAEVGLPDSYLDEPSRTVLLEDYSIKNVFTGQIYEVWPHISQESIDIFLYNTEAPGFFDTNGFIQGGTSPGDDHDVLVSRLPLLSPYNPKDIAEMTITFMN
ncbi:MAG: hypothetical protein KFF49_12380 [Bacteroidales bacterium]|nr:hypothetical protein [Bacteroidales bacterium]